MWLLDVFALDPVVVCTCAGIEVQNEKFQATQNES